MNLPTGLTLFRIFLVPFLVAVLLAPPFAFGGRHDPSGPQDTASAISREPTVIHPFTLREILGATIFLVAAATDFLDGFLARRRNQVTTLGTLLDPIADKLLTSAAFISLVQVGLAPAWMVVVIVGREFAVSGLRSVVARQGITLGASWWGKAKTASQVVAILLLIVTNALHRLQMDAGIETPRAATVAIVVLWVALVLALVSGIDYFRRFARAMPGLWSGGGGGRA
jgi:CDP-diacylglycerol--glycerol-3-phosphate 3-phosphatidyltransferase